MRLLKICFLFPVFVVYISSEIYLVVLVHIFVPIIIVGIWSQLDCLAYSSSEDFLSVFLLRRKDPNFSTFQLGGPNLYLKVIRKSA